jgi:hypothetical protein
VRLLQILGGTITFPIVGNLTGQGKVMGWLGIVGGAVLALTYTAIIAVALFHPDAQRRADARSLLPGHLLARRPQAKKKL